MWQTIYTNTQIHKYTNTQIHKYTDICANTRSNRYVYVVHVDTGFNVDN